MEKRIYHFLGRVQGVGFRWLAWNSAMDYGVNGYIRNLPDGSVECVVEGKSDKIDAFVKSITSKMGHNIQKTSCQNAPVSENLEEFFIKY